MRLILCAQMKYIVHVQSFWSTVCVCGYTMLHSGRPHPEQGERIERNEGVAIVLYPQMAEACRAAGEE